jgi:hypothetical protein
MTIQPSKSLVTFCAGLALSITFVNCGKAHFGKLSSTQAATFRVVEAGFKSSNLPNHPAQNPKIVWISLDGLNEETLRGFLERERRRSPNDATLNPFGIKYLMETRGASAKVRISDPTITSSSHASTMTCAPAGVHGIVSNLQWNGVDEESGFEVPYDTETFVHAMRKNGLRVGVSGYPGFDSKTPNRTPDLGIGYPSARGAAAQFVDLSAFIGGQRFTIPVQTGEVRHAGQSNLEAPAGFELDLQFSPNTAAVHIFKNNEPAGQVTANQWTKIVFESQGKTWASNLRLFHNTSGNPSQPTLYVSPALQNAVLPQELKTKLDESNIVFPFGKDPALAEKFGEKAFIESLEERLAYFTKTSHALLDEPGLDAVFLYFEDLDVLGHKYEGDTSKLAYVDEHLRKFDQALGSILQRIGPKTNVLITGDHGMSAVQYEFNALEILTPELTAGFQIRAAGGSLFVYGPTAASLTQPPPHSEDFKRIIERLQSAMVPGSVNQKIFTKVVVKGSQEALRAGWRDDVSLPWIHATSRTEIGIVTSVEPGLLVSLRKGFQASPELLAQSAYPVDGRAVPEPRPLGQHGHASEEQKMMTRVYAWGPGLTNEFKTKESSKGPRDSIQPVRIIINTNLVPLVADALALPRPTSCR